MPYRSDAQRRFFHTDTAKKAGITDKEVNEFDQASKGKKLPEKKMAFGGETNPKKETVKSMENNPTAGFADGGEVAPELKDDKSTEDFKEGFKNGIQGDWEKLKSAITSAPKGYNDAMGDNGNLKGLQDVANKEAGIEPKKMADGGDVQPTDAEMQQATGGQSFSNPLAFLANLPSMNMTAGLPTPPTPPPVDNAFIHQLNMGTALTPQSPAQPQVNPISQAAQTMNNTPPTSPDIYSGIGAPDRAALAQQLLAQKAQPGQMAASGAGGLADAITGAFGKNPTNFQGNIRNAQAQNAQQRLGIMDTQRQQVMQDIQAKIAIQESDPNSPYSQGMRQFLNAQGMKVPSGMSAAMLKQTLPDVTKIFDSKMQALTAQGSQAVDAGKALMGETFADWLKEQLGVGGAETGEAYLSKRVGGAAPAQTGGWKVVR